MSQIKRASGASVVNFVLFGFIVVNSEPQFASWATCHLFFFTKERTEAQRGDRTGPGLFWIQVAKAGFKPRPTSPSPNLNSLCMIHPCMCVHTLTHTHTHPSPLSPPTHQTLRCSLSSYMLLPLTGVLSTEQYLYCPIWTVHFWASVPIGYPLRGLTLWCTLMPPPHPTPRTSLSKPLSFLPL